MHSKGTEYKNELVKWASLQHSSNFQKSIASIIVAEAIRWHAPVRKHLVRPANLYPKRKF